MDIDHCSNGKKMGWNGQVGRKYQTSHLLSRRYGLNGPPCVLKTDCLSELERGTMQLLVPATRIREVLREMHNWGSGTHFGINKTLSKVGARFYWVPCREDVESCT